MWQKKVKPYVESGRLVAVGVVQEQHPDRTRLYRQWRELDWPVFVDSLNLLEHIRVVPWPIAIDEYGFITDTRFNPPELDTFMKTQTPRRRLSADFNIAPDVDLNALQKTTETTNTSEAWLEVGRAWFNYGRPEEINRAVAALEIAVTLAPQSGAAQFALGGALRRRYETPGLRKSDDAQRAVDNWGHALSIDPNHYIFRRRLQQYGPRLDKPYNFYFWVRQARADIAARGDTPIALTAEPMGSEIAQPQRRGETLAGAPPHNPDPNARINLDTKQLVTIETLITPSTVQPGHRVRARVTFRLNEDTEPWWNNEADNLTMHVTLPDGISFTENDLSYANPTTPETRELRQLEFELEIPYAIPPGEISLPAYALYYTCEDAGGICLYLRQNFTLLLKIDPAAPKLK